MTDHPCKDLSDAARDAFEQIAVGALPNCKWPTIDELEKASVICRGDGQKHRDAMGPYTVWSFYVPVPVHAQWCAWCAEQSKAPS